MIEKNTMQVRIIITGAILALAFLAPGSMIVRDAVAQGKLPAKDGGKIATAQPAATGANRVYGSAWSEITLAVAGGYFMPRGNEATMLDPSWSVKLMILKNNMADTLFGMGCDLSYAKLPDQEFPDGSITYATAMPYATATFSLFDVVSAQFKAGSGISALMSEVKGKSASSMSLTLGGAGGLFKIFGRHFVLGAELSYWYYFQMNSSSSVGLYGYTGYYF